MCQCQNQSYGQGACQSSSCQCKICTCSCCGLQHQHVSICKCCTTQQICSCCGGGDECRQHIQKFLAIADMAWMELLKEKIKEHIKSTGGDKLDEIARVVSETNRDRWQQKLSQKKCTINYEEKLQDILCTCSTGQQQSKSAGSQSQKSNK